MNLNLAKTALLWLLITVLSVVLSATAYGAKPTQSSYSGQYILGPGDILKITLYLNALDREQVTVLEAIPVTAEGRITIPLAGDIKASGLTTELLAVRITKKLKSTYKNPFAIVTVKEYHSSTVTVLGDYFSGRFPIMKDERLLEFVSRSAKVRNIPISNSRAKVIKKDGKAQTVNISEIYNRDDIRLNPMLENNDQVIITKNIIKVTVLGDVKRAGHFEMQAPAFLLDAIAIAGGMNHSAKSKEIKIRRLNENEFESVNLQAYLKNKDGKSNPLLADGDIIFVPSRLAFRWNEIRDLIFIISSILSIVVIGMRF